MSISSKDITEIVTISESEKSKVFLADVAGYSVPVIVKKLWKSSVKRKEFYEMLGALHSDYLPVLYEVFLEQDTLYVIEENVEGKTLRELLKEASLSASECKSCMLAICQAVRYFHELTPPVIHRDIKPENILITPDGGVKLIDFDAARIYAEEKQTDTVCLGTREYAPPEQYGYAQTDARSDIYALGAVFSDMIQHSELTQKKKLRKMIDRCTRFDPNLRYQSIKEVEFELQAVFEQSGQHILFRVWAVVLVLLMLGLGGLAFYNRQLTEQIQEKEEMLEFQVNTEDGQNEEDGRTVT